MNWLKNSYTISLPYSFWNHIGMRMIRIITWHTCYWRSTWAQAFHLANTLIYTIQQHANGGHQVPRVHADHASRGVVEHYALFQILDHGDKGA
jgi:hypothetical protein